MRGVSVGGDGLLSKAGIVRGLFTEEFEKELTGTPPKNENPKQSNVSPHSYPLIPPGGALFILWPWLLF